MSTDNSIYVSEAMFPNNLCDELINVFDNKVTLFPNNHFNQNDAGINRKDVTLFVDDLQMDLLDDIGMTELIWEINNFLEEALHEYIKEWTSIESMSIRSTRQKLQKTTKGGGYHIWHHEQGHIDTGNRVLVWTIYLNDVDEGGETEFLYQSQRVKARKGKIVIFPAGFTHTHRGNPPLSGDKYILTGWWNLY